MVSKQRAVLNSIAITMPLAITLLYSVFFDPALPNSIIIPLIGGGLMNLGFWLFYRNTIEPIPELSRSIFGKQHMFLLVSVLHLVVISILFIFDVSWVFGLF